MPPLAPGFLQILVEGGGITVSQFIEAGVVERLHLLVLLSMKGMDLGDLRAELRERR